MEELELHLTTQGLCDGSPADHLKCRLSTATLGAELDFDSVPYVAANS